MCTKPAVAGPAVGRAQAHHSENARQVSDNLRDDRSDRLLGKVPDLQDVAWPQNWIDSAQLERPRRQIRLRLLWAVPA